MATTDQSPTVRVTCPFCNQTARALAEHIGEKAKCKKCNQVFVISESTLPHCPQCKAPMRKEERTCQACGFTRNERPVEDDYDVSPPPQTPTDMRFTQPQTHQSRSEKPSDKPSSRNIRYARTFKPFGKKRRDEYGRSTVINARGVPSYWALRIVGGFFEALGIVTLTLLTLFVVLMGIASFIWDWAPPLLFLGGLWLLASIPGAVITIAWGHLIYAIRDMAINSYLTAGRSR